MWSNEAVQRLQGCFVCTDFINDDHSINESVMAVTYIQFCEEMLVPIKTIRSHANCKPWITAELKASILLYRAFSISQEEERKEAQRH